MAEPLVLASVTIDESGVVAGSAAAGEAVDELSQKVNRSAQSSQRAGGEIQKFGKHIFSTERVARLLAHQFGLVGMVLGATQLVKSLISGSNAIQRFKGDMEEWWEAGVKMRSLTEVLTERFARFEKEAGITGEATRAEELHKTTEALRKMKEQFTPSFWQNVGTMLWNITRPLEAVSDRIKTQRDNYDRMAPSLQKTIDKQTELATESQALVDAFKRLGLVTPVVMGMQLRDAAKDIVLLRDEIKSGAISAASGASAYEQLFATLSKGGATVNMLRAAGFSDFFQASQTAKISTQATFNRELLQTNQAMLVIDKAMSGQQTQATLLNRGIENLTARYRALGLTEQEALQHVVAHTTGIQQQAAAMELVNIKYAQIMGAVSAFGEMVQAAGEAGIASQKTMFRVQQAILSAEYVQKGMGEMAEAMKSTAEFNYFSATMHKISAGMFFAAAGFHGAAAIKGQSGGGGAEGGGRRGRGASAPLDQRAAQRDISLTVIVDGNVIGNEAWLRGAVIDIQRQLSDGAGGGSF